MRSSTVIFCALALLTGGCRGQEQSSRQKRFLRRDFLNPLSDGLFDLGSNMRDFSEQLANQASAVVQQVAPQATRAVAGITSWGQQVASGLQKRGDRETEDETTPDQRRPPLGGALVHPLFSFGFMTPWWDGPNVCTDRSEVEEPEGATVDAPGLSFNFETTRCIPSDASYTCTRKIQSNGQRKTVVVRRQCCHGFVRRTDGRPGCSALRMEDLLQTLRTLEMNKFAEWVESAGLADKFSADNLTVFVPADAAVADFEDDAEDNEISAIQPARRLVDALSTVSGHAVGGFHPTDLLENEQILQTLNERASIRINKYQDKVVTANCVPLTGANHHATNGLLHLVPRVLPSPTATLAQVIAEDERFTKFRSLLSGSRWAEELGRPDRAFTVFVPTDEAFRALPASLRRQIEEGGGCTDSILDQHVVEGTVCSSAVSGGRARVRNSLGNPLQLTRDEEERARVEGARIQRSDQLATNGVMHVIDAVLIPPQARSLLEALEAEDRKDLLELIELSGMGEELENARNVTFFVPTREALKALPNDTLSDPEQLRRVLQHHVVKISAHAHSFSDNQKLETMGGHSVHVKLQEMFPGIVTSATVQCAHVVSHDNQACGAVIHKVNKVLLPPSGSLEEVLQELPDHSTVLRLLRSTGLQENLQEPFTFLAPTDEAFEKLREPSLQELLDNATLAEQVLRLHVLPESLCCNGVGHPSPFHRQFVRALDGSALPASRSFGDRVRFGRARVLSCDATVRGGGLLHTVSRVNLPPPEKPPRAVVFGMDLFPFF